MTRRAASLEGSEPEARSAWREVLRAAHSGDAVGAWRGARQLGAEARSEDDLRQAVRICYALGDLHGGLELLRPRLLRPEDVLWFAELAKPVGAHREAAVALHATLDADLSAPQRATILRQLMTLYAEGFAWERLRALGVAHRDEVVGDPTSCALVVRACLAVGARDEGRGLLGAALRSTESPEPRLLLVDSLIRLGDFEAAQAHLEALVGHADAASAARRRLAELALWRGDVSAVRSMLHLLDDAVASRLAIFVDALSGRHAEALEAVDGWLREHPDDTEAETWRAELLCHLGQHDEALQAATLARRGEGSSFALRLIQRVAAACVAPTPRGLLPGWLEAGVRRSVARFAGMSPRSLRDCRAMGEELGAVVPEAGPVLERGRRGPVLALLWEVLGRLGGNRTALGTWVDAEGTLRPIPARRDPREMSRRVLDLIRLLPPEEVFGHFDALADAFPGSSMPIVHRGELHLWLGHYDAARADLELAIAKMRQTRWAWYGLSTLACVEGRPEEALRWCDEGYAAMDRTHGPVVDLCVGEALLALGREDEALDALARACAASPGRLSAWVLRARTHARRSEIDALWAVLRRLRRVAPGLLGDVCAPLGDEVFIDLVLRDWSAVAPDALALGRIEHGLGEVMRAMRGNRSSSCITYEGPAGVLRFAAPVGDRPAVGPDHAASLWSEAELAAG